MFVPLLTGLGGARDPLPAAHLAEYEGPGIEGQPADGVGRPGGSVLAAGVTDWFSYIFNNLARSTPSSSWSASPPRCGLGWLCWQAFQAEGGKFQFGNTDMGDDHGSGSACGRAAAG